MSEFAWMVPISSVSRTAHWMEWTEEHKMVKPACNYGQYNPAFAEIDGHAKLCQKCLGAQIREEV